MQQKFYPTCGFENSLGNNNCHGIFSTSREYAFWRISSFSRVSFTLHFLLCWIRTQFMSTYWLWGTTTNKIRTLNKQMKRNDYFCFTPNIHFFMSEKSGRRKCKKCLTTSKFKKKMQEIVYVARIPLTYSVYIQHAITDNIGWLCMFG